MFIKDEFALSNLVRSVFSLDSVSSCISPPNSRFFMLGTLLLIGLLGVAFVKIDWTLLGAASYSFSVVN